MTLRRRLRSAACSRAQRLLLRVGQRLCGLGYRMGRYV